MMYVHSKALKVQTGMPIEYYSEFDASRYEIRKVEVFAGGRLGYATQGKHTSGTELGLLPAPPFSEILKIGELESWQINAPEFEAIWQKATGAK